MINFKKVNFIDLLGIEKEVRIEIKKRTCQTCEYVNPNNQWQSWTGKGRKPNWIKAWEQEGNDINDLKIIRNRHDER